ncbi:SNF related kinase isoform X2 [Rhodnius prolixus]|uniref:SNF related kinase isoform X2 n=1 Tax=Rhodnius prolixus TaxID=13249 RepID=UPI003D18D479
MQRRGSRGAPTGGVGGMGATKGYDGKIAGLYDLETTLGRGHYAVVKMARHVFTGEKVAVKVIDKSKLDGLSKEHLFQEVRCMKLVQHPNVVRLYEVIDTQTKLYLVLELADGGDLYDYIMRHEAGLSEPQAREYFGQIVRAISYCHRLHVVHRDLKPENVVFFERAGVVKLTDFGFSNKFCPGQKLETSCGSLAYSAPEILLGDSYDAPAVDVWSLGVILFMLVCGQAPFQEANDSETLTMIMDCKYNISNHVSDACKRLIGRMLVRDPERRATLDEIASDPWLFQENNLITSDLPLVSYRTLSETDHALIVHKMVQGNICTKEDLLESLEKNEYNYITATYYLLAERKLKSLNPKPQVKPIPKSAPVVRLEPCNENDNTITTTTPNILSVSRGVGELAQRSRKCSIVTEDDEEECRDRSSSNEVVCKALDLHTTLRQAATVPEPLRPNTGGQTPVRTVKTLPSPIGNAISSPQLAGINNNNISRYERRGKLRKGSTASCSSSDASDEDSEGRNKRKGRGRDDSCNGGGSSGGGDDGGGSNTKSTGSGGGTSGGGRRVRGETRLRQSQSLNRITEVQHESNEEVLCNGVITCGDKPQNIVITTSTTTTNNHVKNSPSELASVVGEQVTNAVLESGRLAVELTAGNIVQAAVVAAVAQQQAQHNGKPQTNGNTLHQSSGQKQGKRNALIGRYLMLQRKLCLPLLGSGKSRLYKPTTNQTIVNNQKQLSEDLVRSVAAGPPTLMSTTAPITASSATTATSATPQTCCGHTPGSECCSLC